MKRKVATAVRKAIIAKIKNYYITYAFLRFVIILEIRSTEFDIFATNVYIHFTYIIFVLYVLALMIFNFITGIYKPFERKYGWLEEERKSERKI